VLTVDDQEKPRLKRNQRASAPPPLRLNERDIQIIRAVHEFRVLQQDQIQMLFFGSRQTTQTRLAKLYHNKYLERRFLPVVGGAASSPTLYILDERGAEVLRSELGLEVRPPKKDERLGTKFLAHTTDINTFRIAVILAAREHAYKLEVWYDDQSLSQDYDHVEIFVAKKYRRRVPVIPDSYFALVVPRGRTHFFLEMDRGTMELSRFQIKILAYLRYHASGAYEQRYKTKSLRILSVTTTANRLEHLKKATEEVGGSAPFYFTTLAQITPQTVLHDRIWRVAGSSQLHALIE
jgi:hypothetical protein